ncbi:MAG TPA: sialate O-acetylesterase [Lacipirellulaceae bacterium]|nr:sialate O-acetylesterase [Lacipirellulaceae bacterium]
MAVAAALAPTVRGQQAAVAEAEAPTATLALASMFSDAMVLQRDMDIPIWGTAEPGADVTVTLGDESAMATADENGRWRVAFGPLPAGGPHELVVRTGDHSVTCDDVLIGDVWVASGQSNMEWPVAAANDAEQEIAAANWPNIRFIDVPHQMSAEPLDSFPTQGWVRVTPESVARCSAVGYYFARELQRELDVPIGLVGCNWGGTPMEAWTSRKALRSRAAFAARVDADDAPPANDQEAEARTRAPHHRPGVLFGGMTAPVIPYAIRGVIWYQGESNAGRHAEYAELSRLMIADWRQRWNQGDFPFLLVQLAGWEPGGDSWPYLREAQADTLEAPNVGMAVAIDIGDRTDIHPRNKQEVGRRLALAAQAIAYGEDVPYAGPTFRDLSIDGRRARVAFDHVYDGLRANGDLIGFEIAGADGRFVPAHAEIDGEEVVVSSDEVAEPTQVRYAWAAYPEANLRNAAGLPAVPFRSRRD